ncbi:OLC1v1004275C1 [Oldenlandia corymbosa var. corymbosa]|uniref:OLC1v1004275C1 n=1 Tax=Oldenlandia corymbosa var. corymbosa TaxID=529605 RepID=A0AAV1DBV6_OLDCO|nr:OLC1v1004275C1 [Oldenlandia corymbosa var. corymbosa]
MYVYDTEINGVKVKATLAKQDEIVEKELSELKKSLMHTDFPVVGVDFKFSRRSTFGRDFDGSAPDRTEWLPSLLVLYVKGRCLIIQLDHLFPLSLARFLNDESICFVGIKIDYHLKSLKEHHRSLCISSKAGDLTRYGADIQELAACVLKNRSLLYCPELSDLARRIGFEIQGIDESTASPPDWGAIVFTEEEIKYAIQDAHSCYCIGKKLLYTLA